VFDPDRAGKGYAGSERRIGMCLTCGCGEPNDNHGDSRHIIMDDLNNAAEAAEVSVDEAARNFQETYPKGK
jgi:hypothetical protein